jgi:hypothetical protein
MNHPSAYSITRKNMKVGDLIRVDMDSGSYEELHGQLGVIVGHSSQTLWRHSSQTRPSRFSQWKVRLMNSKLFWFDLDELEVVNESR